MEMAPRFMLRYGGKGQLLTAETSPCTDFANLGSDFGLGCTKLTTVLQGTTHGANYPDVKYN